MKDVSASRARSRAAASVIISPLTDTAERNDGAVFARLAGVLRIDASVAGSKLLCKRGQRAAPLGDLLLKRRIVPAGIGMEIRERRSGDAAESDAFGLNAREGRCSDR